MNDVITLTKLNNKLKIVGLECFFKNCLYLIASNHFSIKDVSTKNALAIIYHNHHLAVNGYTDNLEKVIGLILKFAYTPNNQKVNSKHLVPITHKQIRALAYMTGYLNFWRIIHGVSANSMTKADNDAFQTTYDLFKAHEIKTLKSTSYQTQYLFTHLSDGMKRTRHDIELDRIDADASTHF